MVNHEHKFIFLHIPKTAGCSVGRKLCDKLNIQTETGTPYDYSGTKLHQDEITIEQLKDYFVFTFVRNPWDRMFSQYKFRSWLQKYSFKEAAMNLDKLFIEHFRYDPDKPNDRVKFETVKQRNDWYYEFPHLTTQTDFLRGKYNDGINKLSFIDFVGKFENLQEDFNTICHNLNLPNVNIGHENKSPNYKDTSYKDVYDDELKEFIRNKYSEDIIRFNYEF